ncbi:MAG: hypothetical protein AB1640_25460 [bacterium]
MRNIKMIGRLAMVVAFFLAGASASASDPADCPSTQKSPLAVSICLRVTPEVNPPLEVPPAVNPERTLPSVFQELAAVPAAEEEGGFKSWLRAEGPEVVSVPNLVPDPNLQSAPRTPRYDLVVIAKF